MQSTMLTNAKKGGGKREGQLATQKQDILFYNLTYNLIAPIAYCLHSLFYLILITIKFGHIPLKKKNIHSILLR